MAPRPAIGDKPLFLSYGQVHDYLECPARYRYGHVVRIPTPASHQMVYGKALHAAAQAYHERTGSWDLGGADPGVGVGPEVTAFIRPEGYLVTRFIEGSPVSDEAVHRPETIVRHLAYSHPVFDGAAIRARLGRTEPRFGPLAD